LQANWSIIVHGGAGTWAAAAHAEALAGVTRAVAEAARILAAGASAADAVCAAACILEDDPTFNSGTGSSPNIDGLCEMDACLMLGHELRAGGIANVQRVRNPILVARKVLEETDHALLAGEGANRFARALGFEDYDPTTPASRALYADRIALLRSEGEAWMPRHRALVDKYPALFRGTIGAVALDRHGHLAAATSTGGVLLRLAGRVGDVPIPGAGTYASAAGAASATGRGEYCIRTLTTKSVCDRIAAGMSAAEAARATLDEVNRLTGPETGMIVADLAGGVAAVHATEAMPHAFATSEDPSPTARMVAP
jgi:beta-aspartyl-peptidase (threonine type)